MSNIALDVERTASGIVIIGGNVIFDTIIFSRLFDRSYFRSYCLFIPQNLTGGHDDDIYQIAFQNHALNINRHQLRL